MNQPLITAPCPNCGSDANEYNKVLYDGIFLICHHCGYGWYYNIETFNLKQANNYNPHAAPLNTLRFPDKANYSKNTNHSYNQQPQRKLKSSKQNRTPANHYAGSHLEPHHHNSGKHLNHTKPAFNDHKETPTNNPKKIINYNQDIDYSNNIYYKQKPSINVPSPTSDKKKISPKDTAISYTVNNSSSAGNTPVSTPHLVANKKPASNKAIPNSIATDSSSKPVNIPPKNNGQPAINNKPNPVTTPSIKQPYQNPGNPLTQKSIKVNKTTQHVVITPKKLSSTTNTTTINLSNQPEIHNINHKETIKGHLLNSQSAKAEFAPQEENSSITPISAIDKNLTADNALTAANTLATNNNLATPEELTSKVNNNKTHNSVSGNSSFNKEKVDPANTATGTASIAPKELGQQPAHLELPKLPKPNSPKGSINDNFNYPKEPFTPKVDLTLFNKQLQFNNNVAGVATLSSTDFKQTVNEFNYELKQKETLGLNPAGLLKIEEQRQYNINNYKQPLFTPKALIPDIKKLTQQLKDGFKTLLRALITVAVRPDLLLRGLAYLVVLGSFAAFLIYSDYSKKKAITQSELQNAPLNSNFLAETPQNLKDKDNLALSGVRPLQEPSSNKSLNTNSAAIAKDKDEDKIIAFQKQKGAANLPDQSAKNNSKAIANSIPKNSDNLSVIENLKAKVSSGLLAFKQLQQNSFSSIKIYQNNYYWQGTHNDSLVSNTTLYNEDSKNSYLIRSLEVIFLDRKGKTLSKRVIIANQLINNNSALSLSLKINNPPLDTNKTFVFIKDKTKL